MDLPNRHGPARAARAAAWSGLCTLAFAAGAVAAPVLETRFSTAELDRMCLAPPHRLNVQLMWRDRVNADLDLHVLRPDGRHVYYRDRGLDRCKGVLDHDRLKEGRFDEPETFFVEHETCAVPEGGYQIWVQYFSGRLARVPFTLKVSIGDSVQFVCEGVLTADVSRRTTRPFAVPADLAGVSDVGFALPDWCR